MQSLCISAIRTAPLRARPSSPVQITSATPNRTATPPLHIHHQHPFAATKYPSTTRRRTPLVVQAVSAAFSSDQIASTKHTAFVFGGVLFALSAITGLLLLPELSFYTTAASKAAGLSAHVQASGVAPTAVTLGILWEYIGKKLSDLQLKTLKLCLSGTVAAVLLPWTKAFVDTTTNAAANNVVQVLGLIAAATFVVTVIITLYGLYQVSVSS